MVAKYTAVSTTVRPIEDSSTDEFNFGRMLKPLMKPNFQLRKYFGNLKLVPKQSKFICHLTTVAEEN